MKRTFTLLLAAALVLSVVSCQKGVDWSVEPGTTNTGNTSGASIIGSWKLVSIEIKTMVANEVVSGGDVSKAVTTTNYTTENNTGTIKFDATNVSTNNLGYSINTEAKLALYENGVLLDTFLTPFQYNIAPTSTSGPYKRIGADSLYFPSGFANTNSPGQPPQPGGVRIKLEQNMLYMMQNESKVTRQTVQGQTAYSNTSFTGKMTFQKL